VATDTSVSSATVSSQSRSRAICHIKITREQRVHAAARSRKEPDTGGTGLGGEQVQRAQLAAHRRQVKALQGGGQPPQMRRHARLSIGDMRDRVLQAGGDSQPLIQVIWPPVDKQLRIKRGRQQRRVAMRLRVGQGLGCKSSGPHRIVAVGPGPGQRDGQPRPLLLLRQRVRLVQERRHPAGNSAECLRSSQSQRGLGHRLDIAGRPGSFVVANMTSAGDGRGTIGQPRLPGQAPAKPPHHLMIGPSVLVNCRSEDTGDVASRRKGPCGKT
jgi:hypothetical protein